MNIALEMIKIIQEVKLKSSNQYELYNIKVLVPDVIMNENGERIQKSYNKIQTNYNKYLQTKMNELIIYMKLLANQAMEENERAKKYFTKNYRKYDIALAKILLNNEQ